MPGTTFEYTCVVRIVYTSVTANLLYPQLKSCCRRPAVKTTTIREFRSKIAELISSEESVIVTRHGKPAAVLFSLRDPKKIPAELRRKLYVAMAKEIAKQLNMKKV